MSGGLNVNEKWMNSQSYYTIKEEHPDAKFEFDNSTGKLTWTEKVGGFFSSSVKGGSIFLDESEYLPSDEENLNEIFKQMDEFKLDEYTDKEKGFMKESIGGNYTIDIKKYKEIYGENATLGNLKEILGLSDGVLRTVNQDLGFKDRGSGRDYDTANIDDVTNGKTLIIPKSALFKTDGRK